MAGFLQGFSNCLQGLSFLTPPSLALLPPSWGSILLRRHSPKVMQIMCPVGMSVQNLSFCSETSMELMLHEAYTPNLWAVPQPSVTYQQ